MQQDAFDHQHHHPYVQWKQQQQQQANNNNNTTSAFSYVSQQEQQQQRRHHHDPRNLWWSSEFHRLIRNIAKEPQEEDWRQLKKLSSDFTYAATAYGRIIIEEAFLPAHAKTIPPLPNSTWGFAGGGKFLVRGILFKFSQISSATGAVNDFANDDDEGRTLALYENADAAAKVSGHELRACSTITSLALDSHDPSTTILPPLQALIDYRGFRLLAVSLLPIHPEATLVYGSANGGSTVVNSHDQFASTLDTLAAKLNLAPHFSKSGDVRLVTGTDVEGHVANGLFYLVDLHRLFPSEAPLVAPSSSTGADGNGNGAPPHHHEEETVLPPVLGSTMSESDIELEREESHEFNTSAGVSSYYLVKQLRPTALQKYGKPLSSDAFSPFADPANVQTRELEQEVERATRFVKADLIQAAVTWLSHRPGDVTDFPHRFKPQQFLHERGINVRNLNLIYTKLPASSPWRFVMKLEMCARAFKTLVRRRWRATARKVKDMNRPSHDDYHDVALKSFDLLLMTFPAQTVRREEKTRLESSCLWFWWKICIVMKEKFGVSTNGVMPLPTELVSCAELRDSILRNREWANAGELLLERCVQLLGLELTSAKWTLVTPEAPFTSMERLKPISPSVKLPSLIEWAEANCLRILAARQRNVLACEMLRRAKIKIEEVARNVFLTSRLMCDLAEIFYDHGIRIEPERLGYEFADEPLRNLARAEGAFRWIVARGILTSMTPTALVTANSASSAYDVSVEYKVARDDSVNRVVHAKRWARVFCRQYNDMALRGATDMLSWFPHNAALLNNNQPHLSMTTSPVLFFILFPAQCKLTCYSPTKAVSLWTVVTEEGERLCFVDAKYLCCAYGSRVIQRNVSDGRVVATILDVSATTSSTTSNKAATMTTTTTGGGSHGPGLGKVVCTCIFPAGFDDSGYELLFVMTSNKIIVFGGLPVKGGVGINARGRILRVEDCDLGNDVVITSCSAHVDSASLVVGFTNGLMRVYVASVMRNDSEEEHVWVNLVLEGSLGPAPSTSPTGSSSHDVYVRPPPSLASIVPASVYCIATNTFVPHSGGGGSGVSSPRLSAQPPPSSWSKTIARRYRRASAQMSRSTKSLALKPSGSGGQQQQHTNGAPVVDGDGTSSPEMFQSPTAAMTLLRDPAQTHNTNGGKIPLIRDERSPSFSSAAGMGGEDTSKTPPVHGASTSMPSSPQVVGRGGTLAFLSAPTTPSSAPPVNLDGSHHNHHKHTPRTPVLGGIGIPHDPRRERDRRGSRSSIGSRDSLDSTNAWNSSSCRLRVAAGMSDATVVIYDASTGNKEYELTGHLAPVLSLVFADPAKEKNLLFSSSADSQVRVWNVELGCCLRVLAGHPEAAYRVFYSADQQKCWSLSGDGIREWRFDRLTVLGVTGLDASLQNSHTPSNLLSTGGLVDPVVSGSLHNPDRVSSNGGGGGGGGATDASMRDSMTDVEPHELTLGEEQQQQQKLGGSRFGKWLSWIVGGTGGSTTRASPRRDRTSQTKMLFSTCSMGGG